MNARGIDPDGWMIDPRHPRNPRMLDREGTALHRLESESVLHYGHAHLAKGRQSLSVNKALEAAWRIEAITAAREPISATELRHRIWFNQTTWRHLLTRSIFTELQHWEIHEPHVNSLIHLVERNQCLARLLALDLRLRAYRAKHGRWPEALEEVVAEGHEDLLTDPYSSQPFIYRPGEAEFLLYSVGEDGVDEGGNFTNMMQYPGKARRQFDLDVDTMIRP
jgi:hypothetical protein